MATIPLHGDAYIKRVHGFEKPSKIERNEQEHILNRKSALLYQVWKFVDHRKPPQALGWGWD
jgi:hypothetical protein